MDHLQELMRGAQAASNPDPVPITEQQKKARDAMVVMYMGAATNTLELPKEAAQELLKGLDQKWEALFTVSRSAEALSAAKVLDLARDFIASDENCGPQGLGLICMIDDLLPGDDKQ